MALKTESLEKYAPPRSSICLVNKPFNWAIKGLRSATQLPANTKNLGKTCASWVTLAKNISAFMGALFLSIALTIFTLGLGAIFLGRELQIQLRETKPPLPLDSSVKTGGNREQQGPTLDVLRSRLQDSEATAGAALMMLGKEQGKREELQKALDTAQKANQEYQEIITAQNERIALLQSQLSQNTPT